MVLTREGYEGLGKSDESDAQRTLIDDTLDGVHRLQLVGTNPEALHEQGELLGEGGLLELETVVELLGSDLEHLIELGHEHVDALLLIFLLTTLQRQLHDIDGGEREITTPDAGTGTKTVLEDTCATAHRGYLMHETLRIVGTPVRILIERGVEVQEIGEETTRRDLTGQLIEVEVAVFRQIVHAPFLLPDLDGEDGSLAIAHTFVGGEQDLAHHTTALGTGVCSIVYAGEDHLVTTTRVDGVHIMDEGLHRLMHTAYGLVDGMLLGAFLACQTIEGLLDIVHQRLVVEILVIFAIEILKGFQFFDITQAHVGCEIEVEGRDGLTAVHLVLATLHGDTGQHRGRLNALGTTRGTMTCSKSVLQDIIQRVLHTGERLRGVIIFVVDVQIVVFYGVAALFREQIVVDEGFGGLARELHHHARRRVGVHIGILARNVVVLDVHDVEEHLTGLGLAGDGALVAVGDILLSHVLTAGLHQLELDGILNLLDGHLTIAALCDAVSDLIEQAFVFAFIGMEHGLADGGHDFLFIESYNAPVALYYCLDHLLIRN